MWVLSDFNLFSPPKSVFVGVRSYRAPQGKIRGKQQLVRLYLGMRRFLVQTLSSILVRKPPSFLRSCFLFLVTKRTWIQKSNSFRVYIYKRASSAVVRAIITLNRSCTLYIFVWQTKLWSPTCGWFIVEHSMWLECSSRHGMLYYCRLVTSHLPASFTFQRLAI